MLEGKKKWTVAITGLVTASLGALVTLGYIGEGTQDTGVQISAVLVPLIVAAIYDIVQGRHDNRKEEVKALGLRMALRESPQPGSALEGRFDVEAFHNKVLDTVKGKYHEVNPCTVFYRARDMGVVTPVTDLDELDDYWAYLTSLVAEADRWLGKKREQLGPCGRQSPAYYAIHREFERAVRTRNKVDELIYNGGCDWQTRLGADAQTLYTLGERAYLLLRPQYPPTPPEEIIMGEGKKQDA